MEPGTIVEPTEWWVENRGERYKTRAVVVGPSREESQDERDRLVVIFPAINGDSVWDISNLKVVK